MRGQLLEHVVEVGEDEPVSIRAPPVRDHAVRQNDEVPGLLFAVHDELAEAVFLDPRHRSPPMTSVSHSLPAPPGAKRRDPAAFRPDARAVYAALRRRDRDLEDARHFLVGKADEVPQYERSSVFERQLPHPAGEECVQLPGLRRPLRFVDPAAGGHQLMLGRLELDKGQSLATLAGEGLVHRDPVEPHEDRRLGTKPVEVAPRVDEAVLRGLLYVPRVVEQPEEHGADSVLVTADELRERLEVAAPSAPHERAVVVRRVRHRPMLRPRISADYDESAWTMGASKERWSS